MSTITHGTVIETGGGHVTILVHRDCDQYPEGEVTITPQDDWLAARRDRDTEIKLRQWCVQQVGILNDTGNYIPLAQEIYAFITGGKR